MDNVHFRKVVALWILSKRGEAWIIHALYDNYLYQFDETKETNRRKLVERPKMLNQEPNIFDVCMLVYAFISYDMGTLWWQAINGFRCPVKQSSLVMLLAAIVLIIH